MTEILQQKIKDEILKLPKINRDAINSVDWVKKTEEVGIKFGLIDEEIERLQVETGLILTGLVNLNNFSFNIQNEIQLKEDDLKKITDEITEKIFKPVAIKIEDDIRNNLGSKQLNWKQTINFIISGGDYSAFLNEENNTNIKLPSLNNRL